MTLSSHMRTETADLRRAEVVARAAELFNADGYHQTSMDDIAGAVGMRKSTLYHYFASKDEILFWIHEEVIDLLLRRQEERERVPMTYGQRLLEVIADVLELMDTRPGHTRVFVEHLRELPPEKQNVVRAKRERYHDAVEKLITAGVEAGEFRDLNVQLTTLAVLGECNWAYQWYRAAGRMGSREIAYSLWDFAVNGLLPDHHPNP